MEEHLNPKLQRVLRYFCSLVVACFGVAVSSQSPALGNVRFYFLYAKSGCSNTFNPFLPIVLDTGCYSCVLHRGTSARCG
uniref:Uncharacterized protein n=1 Tax=Siphoviridae sp. ctnpt50 TaxID=2827941 RepID=A0A8S5SEN7_9CAUD|nr:MAG TPA: hypothetical protein [Siphoviridae sp. ctnpt50]